jgi:hypothetical protein
MQKQVFSIELIFADLFVSEDLSRKLAGEHFYRMNPTLLPLWGFEEVTKNEVICTEESYCELMRYSLQ